jgi:hypothetical protein
MQMTLDELRHVLPGQAKAIELAIRGLGTDEAHHKQWYLEQILEALGMNLGTLRLEAKELGWPWESGIAP